jgi:hypothetical protein
MVRKVDYGCHQDPGQGRDAAARDDGGRSLASNWTSSNFADTPSMALAWY